MAGHTPGPWTVEEIDIDDCGEYAIESIDCEEIARVFPVDLDEATKANARLIKTSPKLLAACKAMLAEYDDHPDEFPNYDGLADAIRLMRQAIAEAEGRGE